MHNYIRSGVFAMRVALKGQRRAVLETHVYADLMPEVCISTNPFASSLAFSMLQWRKLGGATGKK